MKKTLLLIAVAFITITAWGQGRYRDVVHLKNGSIIRGVIIELIPSETVKIETADKSIFIFQMDEVDKIEKLDLSTIRAPKPPRKKKGYVGLTVGPSIPIGRFANESKGRVKTGAHFNLINFGVLFSENIGISANVFGATNPMDSEDYFFDYNSKNYYLDPAFYFGLTTGPMFTIPISEKVNWDFKPMMGYTFNILYSYFYYEEPIISLAYNFGTQCRFHLSNIISLLVTADYLGTTPLVSSNDYDIIYNKNIQTVNFGIGIGFRL